MRTGVDGTGLVSHNDGSDRSLGTFRGVRVVFVVKGLRSPGMFIMDLLAHLTMGLLGSSSVIEMYPEEPSGDSVPASQVVLTWSSHVGEVLGLSWFRMVFLTSVAMPGMIPLTCLFFADFSPGVFAKSRTLPMGPGRFPLLAALNGMPQRLRGTATAA